MIYKGLGKPFYSVAAARFVNRFGDSVRFILVLILSISLGFPDRTVGAVCSLNFAATVLGQMLSGLISDRFPRSRLLSLFQCLIAACYLLALPFIASDGYAIVALILLSSVFRGAVYPITNALASDLVPDSRRADAYSLLYLVTNIAVAAGSVVAGLLFRSLYLLFAFSAVLLLLDSLIIRLSVPAVRINRHPESAEGRAAVNRSALIFIAALSAAGLLYNFMYQSTSFILPLEMKDIYGNDDGPVFYSYISMANAVSVVALTYCLTAMTRKLRHSSSLVLAMAFYSAGLAMLSFSRSMLTFMISMVIWTSGEILMATNINAYLNSCVPDESRGLANSVYSGIESAGGAIAPAVCGMLLPHAGYSALWLLLSLLSLAIAMAYAAIGRLNSR